MLAISVAEYSQAASMHIDESIWRLYSIFVRQTISLGGVQMLSYAGNTKDGEVRETLRSFRTVMTVTRVALSVIWVVVVMIPLSAFDAEGAGAAGVRIFLGVVGGLVLALMSWEVAEVVVANFWMKDLIREKRVLRLQYGWRLKKPDALGNSYIRANPTEQYEFEVAMRGFAEDYCRKHNLHV